MNTILISGTAKCTDNKIEYNVFIWGSKMGECLQFIRSYEVLVDNYTDLWRNAKDIAHAYFHEPKMHDGAYTQYLDHLFAIN